MTLDGTMETNEGQARVEAGAPARRQRGIGNMTSRIGRLVSGALALLAWPATARGGELPNHYILVIDTSGEHRGDPSHPTLQRSFEAVRRAVEHFVSYDAAGSPDHASKPGRGDGWSVLFIDAPGYGDRSNFNLLRPFQASSDLPSLDSFDNPSAPERWRSKFISNSSPIEPAIWLSIREAARRLRRERPIGHLYLIAASDGTINDLRLDWDAIKRSGASNVAAGRTIIEVTQKAFHFVPKAKRQLDGGGWVEIDEVLAHPDSVVPFVHARGDDIELTRHVHAAAGRRSCDETPRWRSSGSPLRAAGPRSLRAGRSTRPGRRCSEIGTTPSISPAPRGAATPRSTCSPPTSRSTPAGWRTAAG